MWLLKKDYLMLTGCVGFQFVLFALVLQAIYPLKYHSQALFFSELISYPINLPYWSIYLFEIGALLVFWLINRLIFNRRQAVVGAVVFALSPWGIYLTVAGSSYIYLLFLFELIWLGVSLLKTHPKLGKTLFIIGTTLASYSSFFGIFLILPALIALLIICRGVKLKHLVKPSWIALILLTPLVLLMLVNPKGLKTITQSQVNFLQDPGLINGINLFQGESKSANLGLLSRLGENKYLGIAEYSILKFLQDLTPATYFTPQEKLLNFSFSPPILIGFLIPCLLGLITGLTSELVSKKLLFGVAVLTLPSVLSGLTVDLNRLVLVMPFVIILVSGGLSKLYQLRRVNVFYKSLFYATILIVFSQLLVMSFDIYLREPVRWQKIIPANSFEIAKQ